MRDHVLNTYAMTLNTARALVDDVPCERFAELPFDSAKHPGWVLGHLAIAGAMGAAHIREPENPSPEFKGVPSAWMASCMGAPTTDRAAFGTKDELLAALDAAHADFAGRYSAASDDVLNSQFPNPDYRSFFPTIGSGMFYLMAHHEGYHLGQLSMWRRGAGFGPAAGLP